MMAATLPLSAFTDKQKYTQTIKRQMQVDSRGTVTLHNMMGSIRTEPGTGNRLKLTITVTVNATSENRAQDFFDRIDFDIADNPRSVRVETRIDQPNIWNNRSKVSDYSIDYLVVLPATMKLNLRNRFGKVNLAEIENDAQLEVAHGDLSAGNVSGHLRLSLTHGHGKVGNLGNLTADLAHATLSLQNTRDARLTIRHGQVNGRDAKYLALESQHSGAEFARVDRVDYEGRYDDLRFNTVDAFYGEGNYSTIASEGIRDRLELDLRYGNVRIDHLHRGFSTVSLSGQHTDYRIIVAPDASFSLDAAAEYAGIRYPKSMEVTYEQERGTEHHVRAYVGTPNPRSVIRASLNYGALRLSD